METFDTVVIGAGHAGLMVGYHLKQAGRSFVILHADERVGDVWRQRYDSLRLFTPSYVLGFPGMRFPMKRWDAPTRDEFADFLEAYATRFALPVRGNTRVDRVSRDGDTYVIEAGAERFEAANVVLAVGAHRAPRLPAFSSELDPSIVQLHSTAYRNPSQLREGPVLIVGAGNSGADIAMELAPTHETWLSGPIRGHVPVDVDRGFARHIGFPIVRFVQTQLLSLRTPIGRKARAKLVHQGDPLIRVKPKWLDAAGVKRVGKTVAANAGRPVLEDGRDLDVANIVWCTGSGVDLSWLDVPVLGEEGMPTHERGVVQSEPGLYFVGLPFQFSAASAAIPGTGRDAEYVARQLLKRSKATVVPPVAAAA
jgi:putative flavoprotein involved in K+ transport